MCVLAETMFDSKRAGWTNLSSAGAAHWLKVLPDRAGDSGTEIIVIRSACDAMWRLLVKFRQPDMPISLLVESMGLPVHGDKRAFMEDPWTIIMEFSRFEACALEATYIAGYLAAHGQLKPPEKEQG